MNKIILSLLSLALVLATVAPVSAVMLNINNTAKNLQAQSKVSNKILPPKPASKPKESVVKKQDPRIKAFKIYQQAIIKARANYNTAVKTALNNYKASLKKAVTKKEKTAAQTTYKQAQQDALRAYKGALKAATEARQAIK